MPNIPAINEPMDIMPTPVPSQSVAATSSEAQPMIVDIPKQAVSFILFIFYLDDKLGYNLK